MILCVSGHERLGIVRASDLKEEQHMKLTTRFELASKSTPELRALYRDIFNALSGATQPFERLNAIASLQNIRIELASRGPGF